MLHQVAQAMSNPAYRRYERKLNGAILSYTRQFSKGLLKDTAEDRIENDFDLARAKWYLSPEPTNMKALISQSQTARGQSSLLTDLKALQRWFGEQRIPFEKWVTTYVQVWRRGDPRGIKSWTWDKEDIATTFTKGPLYTGQVRWIDAIALISFENEIVVSSDNVRNLMALQV